MKIGKCYKVWPQPIFVSSVSPRYSSKDLSLSALSFPPTNLYQRCSPSSPSPLLPSPPSLLLSPQGKCMYISLYTANYVSSDGQCQTSDQYCCNSVQKASSPQAAGIISSLIGVVVNAEANVGLTCSPLTIIGIAGNSWYVCMCIDWCGELIWFFE